MEQLFFDILLILFISTVLSIIFARLKFHPALAFITAGILIGPYGFQFITNLSTIHIIAEIGIILLLFIIGIEFSVRSFWKLKRFTLLGGALQVIGTALLAFPLPYLLTRDFSLAFTIGCIFALSSTAMVLSMLQRRNELITFHGRISTGILIFQDLAAVLLMFLLPILFQPIPLSAVSLQIVKSLLFLAIVAFLTVYGIPFLSQKILRFTSQDILPLFLLTLCFGIGWITHELGLSIALGAFIAGLSVSETDFNIEAIGKLLPVHTLFMNFFFVSFGLSINLPEILEKFLIILPLSIGLMGIKAGVIILVLFLLKVPFRFALFAGILLSQAGEFALVLFQGLHLQGIFPTSLYDLFTGIVVVTMALTPLLPLVITKVSSLRLGKAKDTDSDTGSREIALAPETSTAPEQKLSDHIIIVGFGIVGRAVAQAAEQIQIPYVVIEANYATVQNERKNGVPIYFGDAANEHVLEHFGIATARIIALTFPHAQFAKMIIRTVRHLNPSVPIVARTLFASEVPNLYTEGATVVICDELESGTTFFSEILKRYVAADRAFYQFREHIRHLLYHHYRGSTQKTPKPSLLLQSVIIPPHASITNKTLRHLNLPQQYGILIVGYAPPNGDFSIPHPDQKLEPEAELLVAGTQEHLHRFLQDLFYEALPQHPNETPLMSRK